MASGIHHVPGTVPSHFNYQTGHAWGGNGPGHHHPAQVWPANVGGPRFSPIPVAERLARFVSRANPFRSEASRPAMPPPPNVQQLVNGLPTEFASRVSPFQPVANLPAMSPSPDIRQLVQDMRAELTDLRRQVGDAVGNNGTRAPQQPTAGPRGGGSLANRLRHLEQERARQDNAPFTQRANNTVSTESPVREEDVPFDPNAAQQKREIENADHEYSHALQMQEFERARKEAEIKHQKDMHAIQEEINALNLMTSVLTATNNATAKL